ncbi:response regulator transcription factor [Diaphorobacter sp. HDW4A]|uniref:response regulator transcription factor n=1 Tax=Diaphorobacter sp. HDW4A TaxID=2714924 RepID=UPI00140E5D40|nr:response regulator transcription factor [Diaphorobacter sp. HDW4A]QIL83266.1 response regulator transcription factor [Diaphorobacter sp. HDW4A]
MQPRTPPSYALVIDDHPMVAQGMGQMLSQLSGVNEVRHVASAAEGLQTIAALGAPLIVIMDFWLEDGGSTRFVTDILTLAPDTRLLMVSGDSHPALPGKVSAAGAHGLIHKSCTPDQFKTAALAALSGSSWVAHGAPEKAQATRPAAAQLRMSGNDLGLTQRQTQVLDLVLKGKPNKVIAQSLTLSEHTVKEHVTAILQKLGCTNRVELITRMQGVDLILPAGTSD